MGFRRLFFWKRASDDEDSGEISEVVNLVPPNPENSVLRNQHFSPDPIKREPAKATVRYPRR